MATPYVPQAKAPQWEAALRTILSGDEDLLRFVQGALGYSLTGHTTEQCFMLLHGHGSNGKTLLLETVSHILGAYGHAAPFSLFDHAGRGNHPQDLAQIEGKRFVTASEGNESCRLNEDRLKAMAGGERITAHLMRENDRTFPNHAKVWLSVNHRPRVHDDSDGFWRKARLIRSVRRFVSRHRLEADPSLRADPAVVEADVDLARKLKEEAPGILQWLVDGAVMWYADGLREPTCVRAASDAWRSEADDLSEFLSTCCNTGMGRRVTSADLYGAYVAHAGAQGARERDVMSPTAFGRRMGARFDKKPGMTGRDGKRTQGYLGIGLSEYGESLSRGEL